SAPTKLTSTSSNPTLSNITNTTTPNRDPIRESNPNREKFLGFDAQILSDILSPKAALCDRRFQLTVDDVTFLGIPTLLNADRPGTGHQFARNIQRRRLAETANIRCMGGDETMKEPASKEQDLWFLR